MVNKVKISVVIPHYNGIDILKDCLESLYSNSFREFETLLIDNGSTDGSQNWIREHFPQVRLVQNELNRGYAGGCNQGIDLAASPFVLLLNNDTVLAENMLSVLYETIVQDESIAAVQPKILSIQDPSRFDYSGAAGGELDIFGYPFARGRVFDRVEEDKQQYANTEADVFWTSGCAILMRREALELAGKLDETFFAHQEEIDWNWRVQLVGFRNVVTVATWIKHYSGYTLRSDNERKMYLNHRNNLIMMIKNYSLSWLILLLPLRIVMEFATVAADVILWDGRRSKAVLKSLLYLLLHPLTLTRKHRAIQRIRKVGDRKLMGNMFQGSVVWEHFIRKRDAMHIVKKFRKEFA